MVLELLRAQGDQALDLLVPGAVLRHQVEVDPVLDLLALLDPDEEQRDALRVDLDLRVTGHVALAQGAVHHLRPEHREGVGVGAVERHMSHKRSHAPTVTRQAPLVQPGFAAAGGARRPLRGRFRGPT